MSYYPLALVILLAFAGGWVWRGVWDLWRQPKAKVYGKTGEIVVRSGPAGIVHPVYHDPALADSSRLRAVD